MGRGRREIGGQRRLLVQAGNVLAFSCRFAKSSEKVWQPLKGVGGWMEGMHSDPHKERDRGVDSNVLQLQKG